MDSEVAANKGLVSQSAPESCDAVVIAGFWQRFLALAIDGAILGIIGLVLGFMFFDKLAGLGGWGRLAGFLIALVYYGLLNSSVGGGQTAGKRISRIRVVHVDGSLISVARSILRYSVLGLPYFLNGAMIPPSVLTTPIGIVVYLLVFGVGGAIIYLYIFNRKTRQSLHDLIAATYVVKARSQGHTHFPSIWKGHLYIIGAYILLSAALPVVVTPILIGKEPFADLMAVHKSILDSGKVHMASVFVGRSAGPNGDVDYLSAYAVWKSEPLSFEQAGKDLAAIVLKNHPDAFHKDVIVVTIAYGYDIGISSSWRSATAQGSPQEWIDRQEGSALTKRPAVLAKDSRHLDSAANISRKSSASRPKTRGLEFP